MTEPRRTVKARHLTVWCWEFFDGTPTPEGGLVGLTSARSRNR